MSSDTPQLFRAHSTKYLKGATGIITNPNLQRRRRPRDLPIAVHQLLVDWFLMRFNVDYRGTSLFCTGDAAVAAGYRTSTSTLIAIEPVGEYSLCYSTKCKDLFGYYQFHWSATAPSAEKIQSDMDSLEFVHQRDGGLEAAAASGHEVMLVAVQFRYRLA